MAIKLFQSAKNGDSETINKISDSMESFLKDASKIKEFDKYETIPYDTSRFSHFDLAGRLYAKDSFMKDAYVEFGVDIKGSKINTISQIAKFGGSVYDGHTEEDKIKFLEASVIAITLYRKKHAPTIRSLNK